MPISNGKKTKKDKVEARQIKIEEAMPKRYKINRNATIYTYFWEDGMTISQIADALEISSTTVRHVINTLIEFRKKGSISDYFTMAYDICDEIVALGKEPDHYLPHVMGTLWRHDITSPSKLKKMKVKDFEELLESKDCVRYPVVTPKVLRSYRDKLKAKK